jgi:hypothetical protein
VSPEIDRAVAAARETSRGIVSLRAVISPDGAVVDLVPLTKQLSHAGGAVAVGDVLLREVAKVLQGSRFPAAAGPTRLYLPLTL